MFYLIIIALPVLLVSYVISNAVRTSLWRAGNRYYDLFSILSFIVSFVILVIGGFLILININWER